MGECESCPINEFSIHGALACSDCPIGYHCTGDDTEQCVEGTYSNDGSSCKNCTQGYRCPGGTDQIPCESGEYQSQIRKKDCEKCPEGKFQSSAGKGNCDDCKAGYACPPRSKEDRECGGINLYCPKGTDKVLVVGEGHYTTPETDGTTTTRQGQAVCEAGYACIGGERHSCDGPGVYSDELGLTSCKRVKTCEAGSYIESIYTSTSDSVCKACPPGKASAGIRLQQWAACGGGTNERLGQCDGVDSKLVDEFHALPLRCCSDISIAGWVRRPFKNDPRTRNAEYCDVWTESDANWDCQYSLTYTNAGEFCASVGGRLCTLQEVEDGCAHGTGCHGMDKSLIWTSTNETVYDGQYNCTSCTGEGEYSDGSRSRTCRTVPARYKPTANHVGLVPCEENTFSLGARSTCTPCPAGGHSKPGSAACEFCSTGEYHNKTSNSCELCPLNTFNISGASDIHGCKKCPPGGHSQPGSGKEPRN